MTKLDDLPRSGWFPMSTEPVHEGAYELDRYGWFSYWNGKYWELACMTPEDTVSSRYRGSKSHDCYNGAVKAWRGITK